MGGQTQTPADSERGNSIPGHSKALNKGQGTRNKLTEKAAAQLRVTGGAESSKGHPPPIPLCFTLFQKYLQAQLKAISSISKRIDTKTSFKKYC